jgi:hypothetical protein
LSRGGEGKGQRGEERREEGGKPWMATPSADKMAIMEGDDGGNFLVEALGVEVSGRATTSLDHRRSVVEGAGAERHLEGRRRGDGVHEQERSEKGEGERTIMLTNCSHSPNRE